MDRIKELKKYGSNFMCVCVYEVECVVVTVSSDTQNTRVVFVLDPCQERKRGNQTETTLLYNRPWGFETEKLVDV